MSRRGGMDMQKWLLGAVLVLAVSVVIVAAIVAFRPIASTVIQPAAGFPVQVEGQGPSSTEPLETRDISTAYTANYDFFDVEDPTTPEVFPVLFVERLSSTGEMYGVRVVDGAGSNSTTANFGDVIRVWCDDDASFYCDSPLDIVVNEPTERAQGSAHNVFAQTDPTVTCYDSAGTLLSAGRNNSDYNISVGTGTTRFSCVIKNDGIDVEQRIKSFAFIGNNATRGTRMDVDYAVLIGETSETYPHSDWTQDILAKELSDQNLTISLIASQTESNGYERVVTYKRGTNSIIKLSEGEELRVYMNIVTTENPGSESGHWFGFIALDGGFSRGSDGHPHFNYYQEHTGQNVTDVGLAETLTSPMGLDIGAIFSSQ